MKLPGIEYSKPVHGLGRENVGALLAASTSKVNAVKAATGVASGLINKYVTEYQERQMQIGFETAALGMAQAQSDFIRKNGDRSTYKASELPDSIDVQRTRNTLSNAGEEMEVERTDIPAYEVRPEIYKDYMEKQVRLQAQNIPGKREQDAWISKQLIGVEEGYGSMLVSSIAEQKKVVHAKRTAQYKMALEEQKWDVANEIVNNMEITPEEKAVFLQEVDETQEMSAYRMNHANLDVEAMRSNIDYLLSEDYDVTGNFDSKERDQIVTFLRSGIASAGSKSDAEDKIAKSILSSHVSRLGSIVAEGQDASPDMIQDLWSRALRLGSTEMAGRINNIMIDQEALTGVKEMLAQPGVNFAEMETGVQSFIQDQEKLNDPESLIKAHAMRKMFDGMVTMYDNDPVKFAETYLNIPVTPLSPKNIGKVGQERFHLYQSLKERFGYAKSPLSDQEQNIFVDAIRNNGAAQNMALAEGMYAAFGDEVGPVLEDLGQKGAGMNFMVAGDAVSRGNLVGAKLVFEGAEMAATDPKYTEGFLNDLERSAEDLLQTTYRANLDKHLANKRSLVNAYYALAKAEGVRAGVWDKGVMERAARVLLGNKTLEYSDYMMEVPTDHTPDTLKRWLRDTHHSYMDKWKLGNGWSSKKVWEGLTETGDFQFVAVAPNTYYIMDSDTGQALFDYSAGRGKGQPLQFKFGEAITKAEHAYKHGKPNPPDKTKHGWGGLRERIHKSQGR